MARPSKYDPLITPVLARALARDGHTDEEIAERLHPPIGVATLNRWKSIYPELYGALGEGKAVVDARVEDSLLKRALGFTTTETRLEAKSDEFGRPMKGGKVIRTTREVPPDSTAAIFWLKNRKPEQWRDKQSVAIGIDDGDARIKEWLAVTRPTSQEVAALFVDDEAESVQRGDDTVPEEEGRSGA